VPGFSHIIVRNDLHEGFGGARVLLAEAGCPDHQGDCSVRGRKALCVLIVPQRCDQIAAANRGISSNKRFMRGRIKLFCHLLPATVATRMA
jgi:hypothetical protein